MLIINAIINIMKTQRGNTIFTTCNSYLYFCEGKNLAQGKAQKLNTRYFEEILPLIHGYGLKYGRTFNYKSLPI
jgi:hypothetical protein